MKGLITIIGLLVLIGAVAVPVTAWGPGSGRGHHMMGYWDSGPGYSSSPDLEKARGLQGEISGPCAKLDEKTPTYEPEARKILPEQRSGYPYGGGYGRHMGAYGHGMGYGSGGRSN